MGKIPKNLSDKDMFKDYKEEDNLEDSFLAREAAREREKEAKAVKEAEASGISPDLLRRLGEEVMKLKLELFAEGIRDANFKVTREGKKIILALD